MELIPFNKPSVVGSELSYMQSAVSKGHISGDGYFTKLCENFLTDFFLKDSLLTTSCTHSLEMGARLIDIGPGDEVIMPSFTFVSTANAIVHSGGRPVFADIELDNLNIDIKSVEKLVTHRTKAIAIVHYGGAGADPDSFVEFCSNRNIALIEDNAHGFGGIYKSQLLGTFGDLSTLSFHETKNIICGEGGAIVLNNKSLLERARILREKGTNRSQFLQGQVDKYTWVDEGSSWVMSDLLAAFLYGQLEKFGDIDFRRKQIWDTYHSALSGWSSINGVSIPNYPDYVGHTGHLFFLRFSKKEIRDRFIQYMKEAGIMTPFHYQALHAAPFAKRFNPDNCPNSLIASETLVRLPIYYSLSPSEQDYVIDKVKSFV